MSCQYKNVPPRLRVGGFTLIELLVVVGIIGLVLAILMPALSRARQEAYKIQCAGQLRQWGTGLTAFASEHNNQLPTAGNPGWDGPYSFYGDEWEQFMARYIMEIDMEGGVDGENVAVYCPTADHLRESFGSGMMGYYYLANRDLDGSVDYLEQEKWAARNRLDSGYARAPIVTDTYHTDGGSIYHSATGRSQANHVNPAADETVLGENFLYEDASVQWHTDDVIDRGATRRGSGRDYWFKVPVPGLIVD